MHKNMKNVYVKKIGGYQDLNDIEDVLLLREVFINFFGKHP